MTSPEPGPGPTEWGTVREGVGLGPWVEEYPDQPRPTDPRFDEELLNDGDRRNVVDAYRYWRREAIVEDIDTRRHTLHVAIENFENDANIGTVVRTANAFAAEAVHIVGKKRWNRRGAMVTDRYQHLLHHSTVQEVVDWAAENDLTVVAVDNVPGSVPLETTVLPERCLLLFGQEGPGVTEEAREQSSMTVSIAQFGSTRSINAGVAAGIAMHSWVREHADLSTAW
ncbi:TrmH family RNA methyltransferase [Corynebacterium sputi]|uniref:TrmH family RNA methyltransferase n=1 Tax=Corynebacterium sputi TaxID=489915 RepID=UPI00041E9067|nr:RNA methyltransferase [Corynebacterium sputi]